LDTKGKVISAKSKRFQAATSGQQTTLTVLNVDNDVQGIYTLKVSNELGEAQCKINIEVVESPGTPARPVIEKQEFDSVSLKWAAVPGSTKYIVEMKKVGF
uniref:I-set domain-containing protein n=1 Tax=Gongylonema pulchrum TaxID=637853 RepID=A0A183D4L7_9BILA